MNIQDYFEWDEYMFTGIDPTGCLCYFLVYLFLWIFQIVSKEIVLWIITSIQRYSVWVSIALIGASRP